MSSIKNADAGKHDHVTTSLEKSKRYAVQSVKQNPWLMSSMGDVSQDIVPHEGTRDIKGIVPIVSLICSLRTLSRFRLDVKRRRSLCEIS